MIISMLLKKYKDTCPRLLRKIWMTDDGEFIITRFIGFEVHEGDNLIEPSRKSYNQVVMMSGWSTKK